MPDWRSRLAVSWENDKGIHQIVPVDSFSPTFSLGAEVLNSIEATHIGVVYTPSTITFSLSVKAIGDSAAQLTTLALNGTRFNVILQEAEGGKDWSFDKIVLTDCIITSAAPTNATISGAPASVFSGFSLSATVDPKSGEPVTIG
ncbi:MAG TPA: hypothetical protein VNO83_10910 [Pseudonocardia sp.]|jgi:hypothetical protein|nr:hypothetical protein [Pseudonocardia sp.]